MTLSNRWYFVQLRKAPFMLRFTPIEIGYVLSEELSHGNYPIHLLPFFPSSPHLTTLRNS